VRASRGGVVDDDVDAAECFDSLRRDFRRWTIAAPMPRVPPVTSALRPSRSRGVVSSAVLGEEVVAMAVNLPPF
jgi:hypothetical protein